MNEQDFRCQFEKAINNLQDALSMLTGVSIKIDMEDESELGDLYRYLTIFSELFSMAFSDMAGKVYIQAMVVKQTEKSQKEGEIK